MAKYKVLESFELDDVSREIGSELELEEEVADPFVEQGKLRLIEETEEAEEEAEEEEVKEEKVEEEAEEAV